MRRAVKTRCFEIRTRAVWRVRAANRSYASDKPQVGHKRLNGEPAPARAPRIELRARFLYIVVRLLLSVFRFGFGICIRLKRVDCFAQAHRAAVFWAWAR